jgi:putative ABC transport system substrate-binding protein
MNRREFIAGLGSAAVWPVVARAQQSDRVRRIGLLMGGDENDPEQERRLTAFTHALADLGWTDGGNVRMDLRWAGGDPNRTRALAHELVGSQPDIILANGTAVTAALQRETRTIPIVMANVARSRRQRLRCGTQPAGREHHRLRHLGSLVGRKVA